MDLGREDGVQKAVEDNMADEFDEELDGPDMKNGGVVMAPTGTEQNDIRNQKPSFETQPSNSSGSVSGAARVSMYEHDRCKNFVIDEKPAVRSVSFIATKFVGSCGRLVGQNRMTAVAVRERSTK